MGCGVAALAGLNPSEFVVSGNEITFYLYGKKKRVGKYSDQNNEGHYSTRYAYRVQIPNTP